MTYRKTIPVFILGLCRAAAFGEECDPKKTLKVDAVELVAGKEVPGKDELFVDHGRYRYLFATPEHRDAFKKSSDRYEIQLGGACARMGPLSGDGSAERYAVHDGRIYIFASDACRKRFLSSPADFIETPDAVPQASGDTARRGRELIELAVGALGGAATIDAMTSFRAETVTTTKEGGKDYTNRKAWIVRFPDEFRLEDNWNESKWAAVAAKDDAFIASSEVWFLHPQQRVALESDFRRLPLVILRSRTRPDFVAVASGSASVGDAPVEYVTVAFAGTTTKLGIDPKSGRILSAAYRGRGPKLSLGDLQWTFSDFQNISGLLLPMTATAAFNGEPAKDMNRSHVKVTLSEPLDAGLFMRPPG